MHSALLKLHYVIEDGGKRMRIVTSTGYGGTGSSAVTDILLEMSCVKERSHREYKFLHEGAGLKDLENAIQEGHRLKVDWAINRFIEQSRKNAYDRKYKETFGEKFLPLTREFIDRLCEVKWHGNWYGRLEEIERKPFKEKRRIKCATGYYNASGKEFLLFENEDLALAYKYFNEIYYTCDTQKFINEARRYTFALMNAAAEGGGLAENDYLFIDQLLPPINIAEYQRYFYTPVKTFVVDKDPRDLYLTNNLFWADRFNPSFDVEVYIKWYRATRDKARKNVDAGNTMFLMLDDLVFDYEGTLKRIYGFLKVDPIVHTHKRERFQSEKSRVNVALYRRYDNYKDEVKRIEEELGEYLSPYHIEEDAAVVRIERPIKDLVETCDMIQTGEAAVCHTVLGRLKTAFFGTSLYLCLTDPYRRKKSTLKLLCNVLLGAAAFIPEIVINLYSL